MNDSPELTIRGSNSDDWVSLHTLLNIPAVLLNSLDVPYVSEDAFRDRMGNTSPNLHVLIAETALPSGRKRIIGAAWLHGHARERRRHIARLDLVLHPDYRGAEAARRLLAAVIDLADNWLGLRRIEATAYVEDAEAVDFYTAAGFEIEATMRCYAMRAGRLADAVLLARVNEEGA